MREIRLYGSEGGVALLRHSYPYLSCDALQLFVADQLFEDLPHALLPARQDEIGSNFAQRLKNEASLMGAWMRKAEGSRAPDLSPKSNQVEIKRARLVQNQFGSSAKSRFGSFQFFQQ